MPRKIILLLDGTANALTANTTNLPRLYRVLERNEDQLVYYDPGVGTFEEGTSFLRGWRRFKEVLGMATGYGLEHNVKEAYSYLCQTVGDADEITDDIYLMGFSRGAHTARVLAGMIHQIGLLRPDQMHLVGYAYDAYRRISNVRRKGSSASEAFESVDAFTQHLKPREVPIRCVAVFDTVASMLEIHGLRIRKRNSASTTNNPSVRSVRHAVAVDERRIMFEPRRWGDKQEYWGGKFPPKKPEKQDVEEVWFSGVHADVGGGYPEAEAGLAKISLKWMIEQLEPMGVEVNKAAFKRYVLGAYKDDYVPPDPLGQIHNSMNFKWKILEYIPRKQNPYSRTPRKTVFGFYLPLSKPRYIPPGAKIHQSVFERPGTPPNIPDDHQRV